MNHSTEELILAAHVRHLAAKLRQLKLDEEMRGWALINPEPRERAAIAYSEQDRQVQQSDKDSITRWQSRREEHKSAWLRSNPVSASAKEALSFIVATADALKQT